MAERATTRETAFDQALNVREKRPAAPIARCRFAGAARTSATDNAMATPRAMDGGRVSGVSGPPAAPPVACIQALRMPEAAGALAGAAVRGCR